MAFSLRETISAAPFGVNAIGVLLYFAYALSTHVPVAGWQGTS